MPKNHYFTLAWRRRAVLQDRIRRAEEELDILDEEVRDEANHIRTMLGIERAYEYEGCDPWDILSKIRVESGGRGRLGDCWTWTGSINARGTPAVYPYPLVPGPRRYRGASSAVHHITTGGQHQKAYHPILCPTSCVRPSHRCPSCMDDQLGAST